MPASSAKSPPWATINQEDWPEQVKEDILQDYEGRYGDRRQELVFIGQFGKDKAKIVKSFESILDGCLVTDQELAEYDQMKDNDEDFELV